VDDFDDDDFDEDEGVEDACSGVGLFDEGCCCMTARSSA